MRLTHVYENTNEGVVRSLSEQLHIYHPSFTANTPTHRRRRATAEGMARKVMTWWDENGDRAWSPYPTPIETETLKAEVRRAIAGPIASLFIGWIIKIVVSMLIDWLLSARSDHFRSVMRQRRG